MIKTTNTSVNTSFQVKTIFLMEEVFLFTKLQKCSTLAMYQMDNHMEKVGVSHWV